jgi:hypothetical protein
MENSEDNEYSQPFVNGVIRDYMARKKKNTNNPDADNANSNQMVSRIPAGNPGAAPANNNQRVTGQEVILDKAGEGKQRILQVNNNQSVGNERVKRYCDADLPSSPTREVALTCFGEAGNDRANGAVEKRAITDSVYNRVKANKSYWGGNTVPGVLSKLNQYDGYENLQYKKAENPEVLNEKECQKLKDCISAAQASAGGTINKYTNFKKDYQPGRTAIGKHYFWKE